MNFAAFQSALAENPQAAREAVVDRLLASPHFGERFAAMWLDLARYSDTFGFEKDPHRDIWPFRDWVVNAFNAGMPYDEFTLRQLAGDLLENPVPGDLIATAFHRNTQNNTEGGTDDEEFRMAAVIDRTNTTWTAWNGMTFGCVQCHDHPYDPIPHKEYYEFLAFFNNSEDVDLNSDFPRTKVAKDPAQQAEAVQLEQHVLAHRREINHRAREVAESLGGWTTFRAGEATVTPDTGRLVQDDAGEFRSSGTTPNQTVFHLRGPAAAIGAVKLDILPLNDNPAQWDERGAVVTRFEVHFISADGQRRAIPLREVVADFLAGPFDPNDSLKKDNSGFGEYPMMKRPRTAWFVPESPALPQPGETLEIIIAHGATCNEIQNTVLRRFRVETTADPALAAFLATPERAEAWQNQRSLEARYAAIQGLTIPVMREREHAAARETRVFIRGNRTTLDEAVEPGIPQLFGGPEEAKSRLDMARWITSPENPTSARVLANRLWAEMFGTGIVETLGDFGSSGALPSHPELLDHLAVRLRDHHQWRIKPFLRELVLSSTYRQSHRTTPDLLEKDPRNRLLARGPRQRLTAEMVRDHALALSGLLEPALGGPSVFPPQPDGGQTRHLPPHGRRAEPARVVRLQTRTRQIDGKDCPQEFLEGKQLRLHPGRAENARPAVPFQQYGQIRRMGVRPPAASSPRRRRLLHQVDAPTSSTTAPPSCWSTPATRTSAHPSIGSWATYGLGSENQNLPGFIVLTSGGKNPDAGKSVWGAGFLPSVYQGVQCRSQGDPVLNLATPPASTRDTRRAASTRSTASTSASPKTSATPKPSPASPNTKWPSACRLTPPTPSTSPAEPEATHAMYGTQPGKESFANNCLLARRLAERGVRFIQLFDWGWDSHGARRARPSTSASNASAPKSTNR
jgi:hypothetical protein